MLCSRFLRSHNLLDSKINTVLSMCQDTNLLNPVHGIVQSVVYHEESPPQYQPSYLQSNRPHFPNRRLPRHRGVSWLTPRRRLTHRCLFCRFRLQWSVEVRRALL